MEDKLEIAKGIRMYISKQYKKWICVHSDEKMEQQRCIWNLSNKFYSLTYFIFRQKHSLQQYSAKVMRCMHNAHFTFVWLTYFFLLCSLSHCKCLLSPFYLLLDGMPLNDLNTMKKKCFKKTQMSSIWEKSTKK